MEQTRKRNLFNIDSRYRDMKVIEGEIVTYFSLCMSSLNKTQKQAAKECSRHFSIPERSITRIMQKHGACMTVKMKEKAGLIGQRDLLIKFLFNNHGMAADEISLLLGDALTENQIKKIIRK
jgi:hypothetical protein